jgi:probable rRNA maturation factor
MGIVTILSPAPAGRPQVPACRRLLRALLRATRRADAGVTLLLTTDAEIRRLNRTFRSRNRTTDVLSFPFEGELEPRQPHLGDIAISISRARIQARRAGWPLASEMALLVTHGYLHLLGHDHEADDGTMRSLEESLLRRVARIDLRDRRLAWGDPAGEGGRGVSRGTGRRRAADVPGLRR